MTFRENMKRPLENLRLSWSGHVNQQTGSTAGSSHGCGRPMHNDRKYREMDNYLVRVLLLSKRAEIQLKSITRNCYDKIFEINDTKQLFSIVHF